MNIMNNTAFSIITIHRGTPEWHNWRHEGIGSTDAAAILDEDQWKTRHDLLKEKRHAAVDVTPTAEMALGSQHESEARSRYTESTGNTVQPACLQSTRYEWLRASVDGINVDKRVVVEIKCGKSAYRTAAKTGSPPDYHYAQLQHILAVTGFAAIDYWSYWPGKPGILLRVERDFHYINRLEKMELIFWHDIRPR